MLFVCIDDLDSVDPRDMIQWKHMGKEDVSMANEQQHHDISDKVGNC